MPEHTTLQGIAQTYLLNPEGEVDGLLLDGNRQLKMPTHLRDRLQNVALGSAIQAEVKAGKESEYGQEFSFRRWTHETQTMRAEGKIQRWLVDKGGKLRGFILSDGMQVHIPKHLRKELIARLHLGNDIHVQGLGSRTPSGAVLKADQVVVLETLATH